MIWCTEGHSQKDDNYDLLNQEADGEPSGEQGEEGGEDGTALVNGVNGIDHDADMANGEDGSGGGGQADSGAVGVGLQGERQANKVRVTTPYLTKYERARILGTRALQIRYVLYGFCNLRCL